jgi:hypothetical protein
MLGFWAVSLPRICNALQTYVDHDLSPSDVKEGLDRHLASTGIHWITDWSPTDQEGQAKYLIGMLRAATTAGYIDLHPDPLSTDCTACATRESKRR